MKYTFKDLLHRFPHLKERALRKKLAAISIRRPEGTSKLLLNEEQFNVLEAYISCSGYSRPVKEANIGSSRDRILGKKLSDLRKRMTATRQSNTSMPLNARSSPSPTARPPG